MHDTTGWLLEVGGLLARWRDVWSPRPFVYLSCPWEADWPEVAGFLRSLPIEAVEAWEPDPWAIEGAPSALRGWLDEARAVTRVPALDVSPLRAPPRAELKILARKWQQILSFGGVCAQSGAEAERIVDWCGGKSHLGRTLSLATGKPVRVLELDPALCAEAEVLSAESGLAVTARRLDVLSAEAGEEVRPTDHIAALHACGSLHHRALSISEATGASVTVAPCCHHRIAHGEEWAPWSRAGASVGLRPDRHELRLPATIEIVAGRGEGLLRRREIAWRSGLDLLAREASGVDAYTPVPKLPSAWFRGTFAEFVELVRSRGVTLPAHLDAERAEAAGWDRARQARAVGLVRVVFRRALELWLIGDRVEGMRERGARVTWGTFCPEVVTPRNVLVDVSWG